MFFLFHLVDVCHGPFERRTLYVLLMRILVHESDQIEMDFGWVSSLSLKTFVHFSFHEKMFTVLMF